MNIDILDSISELQITLKKQKAIMDGFTAQFTEDLDKKIALLTIETHYENFQYTAQVLCDLMAQAIEQAAGLEGLANASWEEQQQA